MEAPEHAARRIFGERSKFYTESAVHKDPQVLARVIELAAPRPDWSALDVATGTGHTAHALAQYVAEITCIDITPHMLAEAGRLAHELGIVNLRFCLADAHALPFDDGVFNVVTCRRAAHHFSGIMQALLEMKRVMRAGGRLVIDDRSVPEDDFVNSCMNELDRLHDDSHVREYPPSEWRRLLESSGLTVDLVEPYTKHLPLTSLTTNVPLEKAQKVHAIINELTYAQRKAMKVLEKDGELYLNHWYVMLSAHRP